LAAATTGLSGFDLGLFRPPADRSGVLNVHGAGTLDQWQFSLGTLSDTSHNLLNAVNPSGQKVQVVSDYFVNDTQFAVGLTKFLEVGIDLPIVYFEQGQNFETLDTFETASFGDIAFDIKLGALKGGKFLPGLALISVTTVPSGSTEKFTGYSSVTEEVRLAVDKKIGPVYLVANGGYRTLKRTQVVGLNIDDMAVYGAGFAWTLPFGHGKMDFLGEVDGSTVLTHSDERTSPLEWLVGLRQRVLESMSFELAGGSRINGGFGGDWRFLAGIHFTSAPLEKRLPEEK